MEWGPQGWGTGASGPGKTWYDECGQFSGQPPVLRDPATQDAVTPLLANPSQAWLSRQASLGQACQQLPWQLADLLRRLRGADVLKAELCSAQAGQAKGQGEAQ